MKWLKFWNPEGGFVGGMIFGIILFYVIRSLCKLIIFLMC